MKFIKSIIAATMLITSVANAQSTAETNLHISLAACGASAAVLPYDQQLTSNRKCSIPVIVEYTSDVEVKEGLYKAMISLSNTILGKVCVNNNSSECKSYRNTLKPNINRFVE